MTVRPTSSGQAPDASCPGAGELAADRLRELLGRVAGGFYDQPHVRDAVIRRMAQDLERPLAPAKDCDR